jgi:hypothetical protein
MDFFSRPISPNEDEFWGEPIDIYSDAEALDDGVLVDLTQFRPILFQGLPINRMTSHLFEDLRPFAESCVPDCDGDFGKSLASILQAKVSFAQGDPGNTGNIGDIYKLPPNLWLVRNEVGGWTAMFPEDY